MRLTDREGNAIRAAAAEAFCTDAVVRLFGSRLDDTRRGGDIDLHVQLPRPPIGHAAATFRRLLDSTIGERDYDIVVAVDGVATSAVHRKAVAEGVVL